MKKYRLRILVYISILIGIFAILSFSCFNTWKMIYKNKQEKKRLQTEYTTLINKEETLEGEVVKLQDPEYAAKYAREKYLFSKDGEYIIDFEESKD